MLGRRRVNLKELIDLDVYCSCVCSGKPTDSILGAGQIPGLDMAVQEPPRVLKCWVQIPRQVGDGDDGDSDGDGDAAAAAADDDDDDDDDDNDNDDDDFLAAVEADVNAEDDANIGVFLMATIPSSGHCWCRLRC